MWIFLKSKQLLLAIMLLGSFSACSTQANATTTPTEFQQLRITNSSNVEIAELVILFLDLLGIRKQAGLNLVPYQQDKLPSM